MEFCIYSVSLFLSTYLTYLLFLFLLFGLAIYVAKSYNGFLHNNKKFHYRHPVDPQLMKIENKQ